MSTRSDQTLAGLMDSSRDARALARMLLYTADEARMQGHSDVARKIADAFEILSEQSPGRFRDLLNDDNT